MHPGDIIVGDEDGVVVVYREEAAAVLERTHGRMEVEQVVIDPAALDGADADEVADLVHAALNDLTAAIAAAQSEAMGPLGGLLGQ